MKKVISMILVVTMFIGIIPLQVKAVETTEEQEPRVLSYIDLSSLSYSFQFTSAVGSRNKAYPLYRFKTNTTKINLNIQSDIATQLRVYLYRTSDSSYVLDPTKSVSPSGYVTYEFSSLNASTYYYFVFENLGDYDVNLTCLIGD